MAEPGCSDPSVFAVNRLGDVILKLLRQTPQPSMPDPKNLNSDVPEPMPAEEPAESFQEIFSEYEKAHVRKPESGAQSREGTVIAVTADSIILDIGFKSEGILPLITLPGIPIKPGDKLQVTVKGRDPRARRHHADR